MIEHKYIKSLLRKIQERAELSVAREVCGYLGYNPKSETFIFQQEQNISQDPQNYFSMDPYNFLFFKEKYELIAVFHSHVIGDAKPSDFDIKMSGVSCVPFLIYSINSKNFDVYCPPNTETDVTMLEKVKEKI